MEQDLSFDSNDNDETTTQHSPQKHTCKINDLKIHFQLLQLQLQNLQMHFRFTLVCHFYINNNNNNSVDNDVLLVSSDSDIEMVDFERRQLKGHKKGRSFGPNLKKIVCQ